LCFAWDDSRPVYTGDASCQVCAVCILIPARTEMGATVPQYSMS